MPGQAPVSLDDFIAASRKGVGGPCSYVAGTTSEQRAAIRERVDMGVRKWAAFHRWLEHEGSDVTIPQMIYHFSHHGGDDV